MMRIDRFLSETGTATRSESKRYIKSGRIAVNGRIVSDPGEKLDETKDTVTFDGKPVLFERFSYYMLNKPAGCVSATRDGLSDTVLDLLKGENTKDLFPVGRLDKDTEGLLLITNDGALAHELLSPKKHVDKMYLASVDKSLTSDEMDAFRSGLDIGDEKLTLPAKIEPASCGTASGTSYLVTIHEGRFHQVKRMFEVLGANVVFLKRLSMGPLALDEALRPGGYRKLTEEELTQIKK